MVWFWAIYLVVRDKRGISATQLSREPEIAYISAWYLLYLLHSVMGERDKDYVLSGIIELNDAYFGALSSNGKRGRGTDKSNTLTVLSLTDEGHPFFLKMQVFKLDAESVCAIAQQTIRSGNSEPLLHLYYINSFIL